MDDGFVHHVRATHRLLDACVALSPEQLEIAVPGTYGSILATARHLVGGDSLYLFWLTVTAPTRSNQMGWISVG